MNIKIDKFLQTIGKEYSNCVKITKSIDIPYTIDTLQPRKSITSRYKIVMLKHRSTGMSVYSGRTYLTSGSYFKYNEFWEKYELDYYTNIHNLVYFIRKFINKGYFVYILKKDNNICIDYDFKRKKATIYLSLETDKNLIRRAKLREILR
jgi:hypothetical protein